MKSKSIRLTTTSYAVLGLLDYLGEGTPYALKQALERSVQNFWPVPHTTFYDEPTRLAQGGYLSERQEAGGRRRKVYALTDAGREALHAWANSPELAPQQLRDEGLLKIFAGADPRVIFAKRAEWHRVKLSELEGYLEGRPGPGEAPPLEQRGGVEATLLAGIVYHRQMLAIIDRFLAEAAPVADEDAVSG